MSNPRNRMRELCAEITVTAKKLARLLREKADLIGEAQFYVSADSFSAGGRGVVIIQAVATKPGDERLLVRETS